MESKKLNKNLGVATQQNEKGKISYKVVNEFNYLRRTKVYKEANSIDARRLMVSDLASWQNTLERAARSGLIQRMENFDFFYGFNQKVFFKDEISGEETLLSDTVFPLDDVSLCQIGNDNPIFKDPTNKENCIWIYNDETDFYHYVWDIGCQTNWFALKKEYQLYEKYGYNIGAKPIHLITSDDQEFFIIQPEKIQLYYIASLNEYDLILKEGILPNNQSFIYFNNENDLKRKEDLFINGLTPPYVILEIDYAGLAASLEFDNFSDNTELHRYRVNQYVIEPYYIKLKSIIQEKDIKKVLERFASEISEKVPIKTSQAYRNLKSYLSKFCKSIGQELCWDYLGSNYEQHWQNFMLTTNLSNRTIRRYIKAKKEFLEWCWENDIMDKWKYLVP